MKVLAPPVEPPLGPAEPQVGTAPDLRAYAGKPVVSVEVVQEDDPWGDMRPPRLLRVRAGQPFSPLLARIAMGEAMESGLYGTAHVTVEPYGSGVKLRVHAVPRRLIESLKVDLHDVPVERDDILREAGLSEGGELIGNDLEVRERRIEALLARRGFPQAHADLATRATDKPTRVIALLDVQPGPARVLARRVFYSFGARAEDLDRYTRAYHVDKGDRADETALDAADTDLETRLRAGGWYDARVSHDVVLASGLVTLRVRVDTGARFALSFDGNEHYDADALSSALGVDAETDLGLQHLADKLRRFYVLRGFLDAEVKVEVRGRPADHARTLVFHVQEGERVVVAARTYPCVAADEIKDLRGGGPRSASQIGNEIDSFLDEELPGADLVVSPDPRLVDSLFSHTSGSRVTPAGRPAVPIDLDPDRTYVPDTYDRAAAHVQELYRSEGFLSATVGPVQVIRRTCSPDSPPGTCAPLPRKGTPADACVYDRQGLPRPVPPLPQSWTCTPDRAHGVTCEPVVRLRIPIKLGPRTFLRDVVFYGARSITEKRIADAAALDMGGPLSAAKVDEARRRIVDLYKEEGYFYADVKFAIEKSLDSTQARVRFDITEGDRVIVQQILVRGNRHTDENVIRRRIALTVGQPYRTSDVRKTQERVATLGVFSSVNVALQNPQVPQRDKTVVITVQESLPQYIEFRAGFATGQGVRGAFEYGHKNVFGDAIALSFRAQVSYLPDFLITDPLIAQNFKPLSISERLAGNVTLSVGFPEVGLGPLVRGNVDALYARTLEPYFTIGKAALIPTAYYRPERQLLFAFSVSAEYNNLHVFQGVDDPASHCQGNIFCDQLLRVPSGESALFSERVVATWDCRDNSFDAHKGTLAVVGVEHDDAFPLGSGNTSEGHFVRLTQTLSGYIPIYKGVILAATLRMGEVAQVTTNSVTYPDREFFMGGFDSMRSYTQDTVIPQDAVDTINASGGTLQPTNVAVNGGNLMFNPRVEVRIPVMGPLHTVVFVDAGNLWGDPTYPFDHSLTLRVAAGSGIRVDTPVGAIALDYGFNLTKQPFEDIGALNFAIGLF